MVLLIQIPLKHKKLPPMLPAPSADPMMEGVRFSARASNVENAVVGHGDDEGPFTELDGLKVERDERFPVRGPFNSTKQPTTASSWRTISSRFRGKSKGSMQRATTSVVL